MTQTAATRTTGPYWWGLALGWMALGVVIDLGNAWATAAATLVFGATTAALTPSVFATPRSTGGHGTGILARVYACLLALAGVTILLGVLAAADGAGHPVTMASVAVAVALVAGGPRLVEGRARGR